MNDLTTRLNIQVMEKLIAQMPGAVFGDSDKAPLKHSFADGIYVREIFIPKDTVIVGKIHRHDHPNFLMSGRVIVITEDRSYLTRSEDAVFITVDT